MGVNATTPVEGMLAVGGHHRLWWRDDPSSTGEPIVLLHAGPGGRSQPALRTLFDPLAWRIVQFDQRGCGQSTPPGSVDGNTTSALVEDLERLREHLGITRWALFGQSWGSALALAYAQAHPERCTGLLLSAIYLGDREDVRWFFEGPRALLPEAHAALLEHLAPEERSDPLSAYHRRVFDPDPHVHVAAARTFLAYDLWLIPLHPDLERARDDRGDEDVVQFARIFLHYLAHTFFLGDGVLLGGVPRIAHLPGRLVMGRHDIAVSLRPAWALKQAWPSAHWIVVPDGAYSPYQGPMRTALAAQATALLEDIRGARPR